ncbi:hypothetical protein B0H13DRAFT_2320060 [Mycena leptocephala]|nr:hypothetical protein B0H13DRAFT_2320060 [Mycena leptocephala]
MADRHYNMPGALGMSDEDDGMSTAQQNGSHSFAAASTQGSENSNQSFHSFQTFPAPSRQQSATPHQANSYNLEGYHASQAQAPQLAEDWQQGAGYHALQAQQLYSAVQQQGAGHHALDAQQLYSANRGADYYAPQAQQGAGYSGWVSAGYDPMQAQQGVGYSATQAQGAGWGDGSVLAGYNPAQAQQGGGYSGSVSGGYNPAQPQQSDRWVPAGYNSAQGLQSATYSSQAQYDGGYSPAQVQQSAAYSPAQVQQSPGWVPAGYNPAQAQQGPVYDLAQTQQAQQSPGLQSSQSAIERPPRIDLSNPPKRARRVEVEENGKRRAVDSEPQEVRGLKNDLEYERDMRAHAKGKYKEVQKERQQLQAELVASRRTLHDIAETTNGQAGMYDALQASHKQAMDDLRRENLAALKAQQEQFKRHLDETVDKLRGEYGAELGKEQAQTEVRFAAVAARQVRTSSRSAPYNVSEAESARQDRRLKEARQELEKHPGVFVIPHPAPDGGDESDEESLDETEKQQAALIWAWEQLEKEKKRKEDPESEEEGGGRTACALQTARKSQQQDLSKSEDNAYKKTVRDVFAKATGLWLAKDYAHYVPASEAEMKKSKNGEAVPPKNGWRLFFGKSFATCLHNRILIDRLVDETFAVVERDGRLPEVTKDYLRALHLNVLKGAQFQWSLHRPRDDETREEAKKRAEEWEEERRLQTNGNSRKRRKRKWRMVTAKKMKAIRLQEGNHADAELFQNAGDVVKALGNDGMSSEEERVRKRVTKSGQVKMKTVLAIKLLGWREVVVDKQVKMLDWYHRHQKKRGCTGYDRVRVNDQSESPPPLKLARNLFDPRWLKNQKKFDPDIERTLKIRRPKFKIADFDFNGTDSEDAYEAEDEEEDNDSANSDADADGEDDDEMET